ncbi:Putative Isoflavone reductase family protein [Aspergillus calidoustus]|uniref:Putative Isoflavone reductase family protein n=1 Tax=Aspergillus calidoustus TaxID=454130 RepID=A0A0U5FZ37_ASPCI|nr:Putative Isoflavone reductase family protein [Aspergillus calidoustus]
MPSKILVIGAGELGTQVLLALASHPNRKDTDISVLLRPSSISSTDPAKLSELATLRNNSIPLVPGDIASATTSDLSSIFKNYDTIISCTGFAAGPGTQLKLARAVLDAGVARYIPWQFGVDYDIIGRGSAQELFDEQLDVRDLLRGQSRTNWVIVSTGMFTSFLFEPGFGVVDFESNTVVALGSLENRVTVTAVEDIGRFTAEIVLGSHSEEVFENKPVRVAGDTISYGQLADLVERVTGRKFKRKVRTVQAAREDLKKDPGNVLYKYQVVFGEGKGVAWDVEGTWNVKVGMKGVTAEEWASRNLKV